MIPTSEIVVNNDGRTCTKCLLFKPWSDFFNNSGGARGHSSICKICDSRKGKAYYSKHITDRRVIHNAYSAANRTRIRKYHNDLARKNSDINEKILLTRYMPSGKWICQDCHKEFHFCQIAAHHLNHKDKTCTLAYIKYKSRIERHFPELDKCEWLCLRCHNNRMSDPNLSYAATRKARGHNTDRNVRMLLEKGINTHCSMCGDDLRPKEWEWNHVDPSTKEGNIANLIKGGFERVWREIQKCVLFCANCHALYHYLERRSV
jgi:hypothetical protein